MLAQRGGEGTPEVAEFACAELELLLGVGLVAAGNLIRDAIDLQHRHPLMWVLLGDVRGRVWKSRQVARWRTRRVFPEQVWLVDSATTEYVDTSTWSPFTRLVEAMIIEADPEAAEARRVAALELLERHASIEPHPDDPDRSPVPVDPRVNGTPSVPANTCVSCGGRRIASDRLRPRAVLFLRISEQVLPARSPHGGCTLRERGRRRHRRVPAGPARPHRVSVRPVIDPRGQVPVDAYEVPASHA